MGVSSSEKTRKQMDEKRDGHLHLYSTNLVIQGALEVYRLYVTLIAFVIIFIIILLLVKGRGHKKGKDNANYCSGGIHRVGSEGRC